MNGWSLDPAGGTKVVRCAALESVAGVRHAFSTRVSGGGGAFDLGGPDPEPAELARERELLGAIGLQGQRATRLRQVHGAEVVELEQAMVSTREADAVVAERGGGIRGVPAIRVADCVPVLLVDRSGRAVAAVHAGWRGTAAGVVDAAVGALGRHGVLPGDLLAALGPSIGPCCYEVGPEVLAAVGQASHGGRQLDLRRANRRRLEALGVPSAQIFLAPWCTRCEGAWFFSYRRQGPGGGRMMACVGWPDAIGVPEASLTVGSG